MKVYYRKLHPDAQPPSKGTAGSVGWDLRAVESKLLSPHEPGIVRTGLAVACPPGVWLKIFDRSSLAAAGVYTSAGVIDTDYRGEIGVVMSAARAWEIKAGDRVAQMVVMRHVDRVFDLIDIPDGPWEWVEATDEQWAALAVTGRGYAGFGSTGR